GRSASAFKAANYPSKSLRCSIPRQIRIDFLRPLIDPARHVLDLRETLFAQPANHAPTPTPMMAVHNNTTIAVQFKFAQPISNFAHRNELRLFDVRSRKLIRLAAIEN